MITLREQPAGIAIYLCLAGAAGADGLEVQTTSHAGGTGFRANFRDAAHHHCTATVRPTRFPAGWQSQAQ